MLGAQVISPSLLTRWHCFVGSLKQVLAAEWTPITHCHTAVRHDRLDVQFEHCWPFFGVPGGEPEEENRKRTRFIDGIFVEMHWL